MKLNTIVLLLTALGMAVPNADAASTADELRIVFIAYQSPEQIIEDVRPVVSYLEKRLNRKVRYFVATDYAGVVEALRNKTADMGFMGPLQYVMAHHHAGAHAILGELYNGKPYYTSRIFVRKDSGIKSLDDLRGKSIAFVDPISSSGYLYPLNLFKQKGLFKGGGEDFFKRLYYAGGDEQAIRAVYNKFVDAAGIGQFSYRLLRPEERDEIVYVGESDRLPSHCVVVRDGLSEDDVEQLRQALLDLNEGPNHGLLKYLYGVDGYIRVTDDDFHEVAKVAREFGYLKSK